MPSVTLPTIGEQSIVMTVSIRQHISGSTCLTVTKFFVNVTCGHVSILLWRRRDTLCTSRFMNDVICVHKSRLLDVAAQLKCMLQVYG